MAVSETKTGLYDVKVLERHHMEDVIKRGAAIIFRDANGENERVIDRLEDLPDAVSDTPEDLDAQIAALQARRDALGADASKPGTPVDDALDDAALAQKLKDAGLDTAEKVKAATDEALLAIPGVGPASVAKIRALSAA